MSERSGIKEPGRLHFLCGLPRSGKSLYANAWARNYHEPAGEDHFTLWTLALEKPMTQKLELLCRPRAVVGGDDFRHALHGREYLPHAEGMVFAAMDVAIRALLRRGFDVMVDETCTTQSTLLRYLKIDQQAVPHFIETDAATCIERARASGMDYLVGPIERMNRQLLALRADWEGVVAKLLCYVELRKGLDVAV